MSFKEKYRVVEQIQNHNGALYKGDIVIFENKEPDGSYRVKDSMGKIWNVKPTQLTKSPVAITRLG